MKADCSIDNCFNPSSFCPRWTVSSQRQICKKQHSFSANSLLILWENKTIRGLIVFLFKKKKKHSKVQNIENLPQLLYYESSLFSKVKNGRIEQKFFNRCHSLRMPVNTLSCVWGWKGSRERKQRHGKRGSSSTGFSKG